MSPSLKYLYLSDYSTLVELPSSFQNLHQLGRLEIKNCINLETLPTGINLPSLEWLDLRGCSRLRTFPDISTNIRFLYLSKTAIEEVPWCITKFYRLHELEMNECINLETLPTGINLLSLNTLYLSGCSRLTTFPDISTNIEYLFLSGTAIEEVPRWIRKFSRLKVLYMKGCNKLKLTGCIYFGNQHPRPVDINFTNCVNLDQEALFQQIAHSDCQLSLSGEEVPSYFTYRTTATSSSSLTVPLLPSSLSQPFLRFRACLLLYDNYVAYFRFKGRFCNSFDSFGQAQYFRAETEYYKIKTLMKHLLILDCCIPLSRDNDVLAEMNYTHVDLQLDIPSTYRIKEWGVRLLEDCSSADNRLSHPNTPPQFFEGNPFNEIRDGEVEAIM